MSSTNSFNGDEFRQLAHVTDPDPRNRLFSLELSCHHETIASICLDGGVPIEVVREFDVTKNLYLYAWFVWGFYPVAEHQSLTCLELALKYRFWEAIRAKKVPNIGKHTKLRPLLEYAINTGVIANQGFETWHETVRKRALRRADINRFRKMIAEKIDRIDVDESEVEITEEDKQFDYVTLLSKSLPDTRNAYAHGTSMIHNIGLGTIRTVAEIINQLFSPAV